MQWLSTIAGALVMALGVWTFGIVAAPADPPPATAPTVVGATATEVPVTPTGISVPPSIDGVDPAVARVLSGSGHATLEASLAGVPDAVVDVLIANDATLTIAEDGAGK